MNSSLGYDFDQARRMVLLVIKSDSISRRCPKETREKMRKNREALICALPVRLAWLFVECLRNMMRLGSYSPRCFAWKKDSANGVEAAFANGKIPINYISANLLIPIAHPIFKPDCFNVLRFTDRNVPEIQP